MRSNPKGIRFPAFPESWLFRFSVPSHDTFLYPHSDYLYSLLEFYESVTVNCLDQKHIGRTLEDDPLKVTRALHF